MKKSLPTPARQALIGLTSAIAFTLAAEAADANSYENKFIEDPFATVTQSDQAYVDIPGNEFTMIFRSAAYPEGKSVTIDPDDVMPLNRPDTGRVTLVPRNRLLANINAQLPNIPGFDYPAPKPGEGIGVKGTVPMFKHLTDDPIMDRRGNLIGGGHGLSAEDITDAIRRCLEPRGIPGPS